MTLGRIFLFSILLSGLAIVPSVAEPQNTREACNTWLKTGIQPQGITRADCNFARDAPQGSILRGGTSDTTHVWRLQGDYQKRFVIDTGSEQKEQPQ